jgi:hypothetical protein
MATWPDVLYHIQMRRSVMTGNLELSALLLGMWICVASSCSRNDTVTVIIKVEENNQSISEQIKNYKMPPVSSIFE